MNPINRLNLLLSDILQNEPSSTNGISQGSAIHTPSLLTFTEHDCHSSSILPSITATPSKVPLPPRRNSSLLKHHRQRPRIHQTDTQQQQQQQTQPLLNSSTLDDLFRALTLECEQYLADSSTSTHANETFDELHVQPSTIIQANNDSNDDDYENLHSSNLLSSSRKSSLRTSIEVMSPEKRQVVSINVSSKLSSSPLVTSSRTYPLLSSSCTTISHVPPINCHSSEEDSIDISSFGPNRKRRRRIRKQQILSSTIQSSSSSDERTETINEKKPALSKRSFSTDHRQQRIRSMYDNQPISSSASLHKFSTRRVRRRDNSLQQSLPSSNKNYKDISSRFTENLCSPLSVLLTSSRPTSDFVDRIQQRSRRSRLEFLDHQPLTLFDRVHHRFYQAPPISHGNNHTNIPAHRIPSYPVY